MENGFSPPAEVVAEAAKRKTADAGPQPKAAPDATKPGPDGTQASGTATGGSEENKGPGSFYRQ